jgi:hypothetical protein
MKLKYVSVAIALAAICAESAQATLVLRSIHSTGYTDNPPASDEMNPPYLGALGSLNGSSDTMNPPTFLAALPNPAAPNLPGPLSGAVDASRFSVTPVGSDVFVTWDLTGTGFTLGFVLFETDFPHPGKPPVPMARFDTYNEDQPLEITGSQLLHYFPGVFTPGPPNHINFYGVLGEFHVPDSGNTLSLLLIGSLGLFLLRLCRCRPA